MVKFTFLSVKLYQVDAKCKNHSPISFFNYYFLILLNCLINLVLNLSIFLNFKLWKKKKKIIHPGFFMESKCSERKFMEWVRTQKNWWEEVWLPKSIFLKMSYQKQFPNVKFWKITALAVTLFPYKNSLMELLLAFNEATSSNI